MKGHDDLARHYSIQLLLVGRGGLVVRRSGCRSRRRMLESIYMLCLNLDSPHLVCLYGGSEMNNRLPHSLYQEMQKMPYREMIKTHLG